MAEFKKDELSLYINMKESTDKEIEDYTYNGVEAPYWLIKEAERLSCMILVLKKEAKKAGLTDKDLLQLDYERIGGK